MPDPKNFKTMYRDINPDKFPSKMEVSFFDDSTGGDGCSSNKQTLLYEKVLWNIAGENRGLRYGENPDQPAAFYRLLNGNLSLGETETIQPGHTNVYGRFSRSWAFDLQSALRKRPGNGRRKTGRTYACHTGR